MEEIVRKYLDEEIKEPSKLLELRDNAEFMLEVFRTKRKAIEFNNLSERLKEDARFIQKIKNILSTNGYELYHLRILLNDYKKVKQQKVSNLVKKEEKVLSIVKDNDDKEKTMKVNSVKKTSSKEPPITEPPKSTVPINEEKCISTNLETSVEGEIESFVSLVNQLHISEEERELLISKFHDASEEVRTIVLMMVYDFVNYQSKEESVKLLKSERIYSYN